MGGHSILPPSSSARRAACPGSAMREVAYPDTSTDSSEEGVAAHWVAAEMIRQQFSSPTINLENYIDLVADNGLRITQEMAKAAKEYAEFCGDIMRKEAVFSQDLILIEQTIPIPRTNPLNEGGTPDFALWSPKSRKLYNVDFKYGYDPVDAFENEQNIEYIAGILDHFGINGLHEQAVTVEITVKQPRAFRDGYMLETWTVPASDLRGHINRIAQANAEALKDDARLIAGPQCKHCKGIVGCAANIRAAGHACEVIARAPIVDMSDELLASQLAILGDAYEVVETRLTGLEELAKTRAESGSTIKGKALGFSSGGRLKWSPDFSISDVKTVAESMGVNIAKEVLLTPRQAIEAGLDEEVVRSFCIKTTGSVKLVDSSKTTAATVFGTKKPKA